MAVIGKNTIGGSSRTDTNSRKQALVDHASFTYVAAANQEVFKVWFHVNNSYSGDGTGVEVAVYDITSGTASAPLVAQGTIASLTVSTWNSVEITPVGLTTGNTYAVALRIVSATSIKYETAYVGTAVSHSTLDGTSALAATWTDNANNGDVPSVYAETQTASGSTGINVLRRRREGY